MARLLKTGPPAIRPQQVLLRRTQGSRTGVDWTTSPPTGGGGHSLSPDDRALCATWSFSGSRPRLRAAGVNDHGGCAMSDSSAMHDSETLLVRSLAALVL